MATFGYGSIGGFGGFMETNHFHGWQWTAPEDGTVTKFTFYCTSYSAGNYLKPVLVLHSDLSIVAVGDAIEVPQSLDWLDLPFSTPPGITNATDYVLGVVCYGYIDYQYATGDTATQGHEETDNNYTTPTALTSITHQERKGSLYATYTPTVGGTWTYSATNGLVAGHVLAGTWEKTGVGIRFPSVAVPAGVTVTNAYIKLTSVGNFFQTTVNTRLTGQDADNPGAFANEADYVARRGTDVGGADDTNLTTANVAWDNIGGWSGEQVYHTPNLSAIIQEIIDRAGWASGQAMVIFWDDHEGRSTAVDQCCRSAYSYDSNPTKSPTLHIEWGGGAVASALAQSWGAIIG